MDKVLLFIVIMVFTFTHMYFVIKMRALFDQPKLNQASAGEPLRSGVGVLEGVLEGVRFESTGDLLADLEDDLERDLDREFLLLLSLLVLRFDLLPIGDWERELDRERLSERTGDLDLEPDFERDLERTREPRDEPLGERAEALGERDCERDRETDLLREPDLPRLEDLF